MKFPATRLKKCIIPYITNLGGMKLQDLSIRRYLQYNAVLEDALRKNVVPVAMEKLKPSSFDEAKSMFSKIISEAVTANITDKEERELDKMHLKRAMYLEDLSFKMGELQDLFVEKFSEAALPPLIHYEDTQELAYEETIGKEVHEYNNMYESLITELPGLNISDASDASVDFVLKRFVKLDEATVGRLLDEWVAFKRELQAAMEKFDFILYLLDNNSDLIFKGDCEGLANVVRSDTDMLAKSHREEAVFELLQDWKNYGAKGGLKKKVKSFKERILKEKDREYEKRISTWKVEAVDKKFYFTSGLKDPSMYELWDEIQKEDTSQCEIPEGLQMVDDNASSSATSKSLQLILKP